MFAFLKFTFIAVFVAIFMSWLARINRNHYGIKSEGRNRIAPNKFIFIPCILIGLMFFCLGVYGIIVEDMGMFGWAFSLGFFLLSLILFISLNPKNDLIWTDEYVEGSTKLFFGTLICKRTLIRWTEITLVGTTTSGYAYLETVDQRRIYWSYLYKGYSEFEKQFNKMCPSVARV